MITNDLQSLNFVKFTSLKDLYMYKPIVYTLHCLIGKIGNDAVSVLILAGLSRFAIDYQVGCLVGNSSGASL